MTVAVLIEKLKEFNSEADVSVIALNRDHYFTLTWGGCEGATKENCDTVSLYVDSLNQGENT